MTQTFAGADVWTLLMTRANVSGDRPFLLWHPYEGRPRTWTYQQMARDSSAVAVGLIRRGVRPGDAVLVHLDNSPEFAIAWFACAAIGAVAVTTNTRSSGEELAYFAGDSGAVGVITQPNLAELAAKNVAQAKWQVVVDGDPVSDLSRSRPRDGFGDLFGDPDTLPTHRPDESATMSVQYTSGTTSRPKGVVWSHANALWAARVNASHEDLRASDCHFTYLPLFHTNALAYSMLASLWVGARLLLVPKWSSSRFWDLSLRYRCTWLSLIGLSYRALLQGEPPPAHSYRLFGAGLCDTPLDTRYGVKTVGWWGMTETVSHGVVGSPHLPDRPFSIGRPAPEYGVAVVADDGTPVEAGETGQLLIRGTPGLSLFSGYLNEPQLTRESYDELGWFKTGDQVTVHDDGYLVFADRAKDMLKVGAENVATSEIEAVLLQTRGVSEVAVVGRPDVKLDEVPVAFVVAAIGWTVEPEALIAACRARLAEFKVPRAVLQVRELPRSTLGKVNKATLRRVACGDLDLRAAEQQWVADAMADPSGESAGPGM